MEYQKTVYIFGAGASIGSDYFPNMPGISDFFSKGFSLKSKKYYKNLFKYIDREWNFTSKSKVDNKIYEELNIEELYTHIDISIEKFASNDFALSEILKVRSELFIFILNVLQHAEKKGLCTKHLTFANKIEKRDTIISFNWDTILDTALLNSNKRKQQFNELLRIVDDFHLYSGGPLKPIPFDFDHGIFLKLHGSFNWLVCENDGCPHFGMILIDHYKSDGQYICGSPMIVKRCSRCNSDMKFVIVPPTINKTLEKLPAINNLWNFAYKELERATKIVIIGYSLPPTDFLSNWLLRSACNKKKLNEVIIVDPRNEELNEKYSDLIGVNVESIDTSFTTFEDFVNSL